MAVREFQPLSPPQNTFRGVQLPTTFHATRNLQNEQFGNIAVPTLEKRTLPQSIVPAYSPPGA